MRKLSISSAAAALMIAAAPFAYAEGATPAGNTRVAMVSASNIIQPNQIRASKMLGSSVYDVQNRDIGKVSDVILDRNGDVAAVVVDVGSFLGMGGKDVAVRLSDIKTDHNRLTLDWTKNQLEQARTYQLEDADTGAGTTASPAEGGHMGSAAHP